MVFELSEGIYGPELQLLVVNLTPVHKVMVSSQSFDVNTSLYERQSNGFGSTGN